MQSQFLSARRSAFIAAALSLSLAIGACTTHATRSTPPNAWIAGWVAAPSFRPQTPRANEMMAFSNQSVRQDVRVGVAAKRVRLRLSNELGDEPIDVGRVQVAKIGPGGALEPAVAARFAGQEKVTLRPGEALVSDSIALTVPALAELAISVYYPGTARPVTHRLMVRVAGGTDVPRTEVQPVRGPAIVSAVEVAADTVTTPAIIVAFGDSITEGAGSSAPHADWPAVLAERLEKSCPGGFVVLNAGISGNRVLTDGGSPSALTRLDRDVLSFANVSHVILLEGINDIRRADDSASATSDGTVEELVASYRQIIGRLHARGIKVIGGTLTPYVGTARQTGRGLASVASLNEVIRGGDLFDGVIDFYAALDDPASPGRMRPALSSGDWLHPGNLGYAVMADAIPASLFGPCKRPTR
jgi:lysophospholipase L1-like esterase